MTSCEGVELPRDVVNVVVTSSPKGALHIFASRFWRGLRRGSVGGVVAVKEATRKALRGSGGHKPRARDRMLRPFGRLCVRAIGSFDEHGPCGITRQKKNDHAARSEMRTGSLMKSTSRAPLVWPSPEFEKREVNDWQHVGPPLDLSEGADDGSKTLVALDKFRASYLQRLACERVWMPASLRAPQYQTIIVFDWDDTLICTSYLDVGCPSQLNFQCLASTVHKLIELSRTLGHTCIITNAQGGWVEHSARKYMPGLLPVLQEIDVVSARERYEERFPQTHEWKLQAFLALREEVYTGTIMNVISIGDSCFEKEAAHLLGKSSERAVVKTIKLQEHPSPVQLEKELQAVIRLLPSLVDGGKSIDATLRWRQADPLSM